ncbi:aldehyde dehydrogenase family protein (plasmid) [Cupriavidus necator]|uniref:Aldehyde dehydrogenase family protein n=1 Tax=Cupriavidus necator TaxID=106590 RepID=A0A367P997_CUPNE|nr:aldehyde dehydrogenase family protein [Cupriavidus necator]QQX89566.1 aldehyde dehydrogenase family protein [Cupriavidus necator]RCJ04073.1 aldehyde dehydrogenase family protein [Cupriavidus necator]
MSIYGNYINGEWVTKSHQSTFASVSPSDTGDQVGEFSIADEQQVKEAIAAARAAQPSWASTPIQARSEILLKIGLELGERKAEIGKLVSREGGKTLADGVAEVVRASQVFHFFAGETLRCGGEAIPSTRPGIGVLTSREPVGVVGLITPWNFPIAIASWKIAPALAFGNSVVLKPSEETPAIAAELFRVMARAGVPAGVANLVNGPGHITGSALAQGIDALSFTGSVPTGRKLALAASEQMIRIQLELGGKNPLVILDDADLPAAVECALNGAFFSAGQRCTASSRLIVTERVHDQFVDALRTRMRSLNIGHALDKDTHIGPIINQRQLDMIQRYIGVGKSEGAELVEGGQLLERRNPGFYMQPALFISTRNDMRINQEEVFGPFASVIRVKDYDEALSTANDTEFGLSAGICTTSLKYANHFRMHIQSGLAMVNLPTAGLDYHVPLGGVKSSGYGPSEQGKYAADFYTHLKTAYIAN